MSTEATTAPAPAAAAAESAEGTPRGLGLLLAVCCVAQFMVILDLSIVNVALPSIQSDLEFSSPGLQWVVDAYTITFASFLMLGGRAADYFGQRRTFVLALVLFALASLAGGLAPDKTVLVVARGFQGFAGALMAASTLAIITSSFPPGPRLHRAIGTWAAMNGLGGAAGVLLGGIITEFLSWRWILLINPPIGIAAAIVAHRVVTERRRASNATFDVAGAATLTIGQIALVYGVVEAGLAGWSSPKALVPIAIGVVLLVAFGFVESRIAKAPLIPFKQLTKGLKVANNIVLLFSAALFPMWFISSLYMQQVLGLSPFHTGITFLPMTIAIMLIASRAGKLVSAFGVRAVLGSGLVMMTVGLVLFAKINSTGSAWVYVVIPGVLTASGIAMSIVPSTIAATQGAGEGQAGLASGLVNTSRQIGGGLGLAVLITLATQHSSDLIGQGFQVKDALTHGFSLAYEICAGLCAAAAILTFVAVPAPEGAFARSARRLIPAVALTLFAFVGLSVAFDGNKGAPIGQYTTAGAYTFVTAPGLHPPIVKRVQPDSHASLAPGYVLASNFYDLNKPPIVGQSGPMILDRSLQPVWFQPVPESVVASNLTLQSYHGKPVLGWWQGRVTNTGATETGEDVVVDEHYRPVAKVKATGGWVLTLHELQIDSEGHLWATAEKNIPKDLASYGGAYNGALADAAVQEYDLQSGKLIRSWDALDHIPLRESQATAADQRLPLGRLPHQLDPARPRRQVPGLDAQHLGGVPGRRGERQDRVDARRELLELQVRRRRRLRVAARRAPAGRRHRLAVRRPLLPADRRRHLGQGDGALARARAARRRVGENSLAGRPVRPGRRLRNRIHGLDPTAGERQHVRRLGLGTLPLRVRPLGQAAVRRHPPRTRPELPRAARVVDRHPGHEALGRGATRRQRRHRVRELERRHAPRLLACAGRVGLLDARARESPSRRVRDGDRGARGLCQLRGPGARRRRPPARDLERVRGRLVELELAVAVDDALAAAAQLGGDDAIGRRDDVGVDARVVEAETLPLALAHA